MKPEHVIPKSNDFPTVLGDLLATKMEIPILGSKYIRRAQLTSSFEAPQLPHVTLVIAAAGYGKTTLLGEWLSNKSAFETKAAWVSLNTYDNDSLRFWAYVVTALNKAYPDFQFDPQRILHNHCNSVSCPQLNSLLNAISQVSHPFCLVLDDYHTIQEQTIHQGLAYFIDNIPANLHLIISSRKKPQIPLSRLRSHRRMTEISERDLSFNLNETEEFLSSVMELDINHEGIVSLYELTEGWVAGLQLAALSLQEQRDQRGFIASFAASHRHIVEYMTEEVLRHLEQDKIDFLLQTSILNELSAPLCDAILERSDSWEMLNKLERGKLFVKPLDERQSWYRFHALFAETLQSILTQKYPGMIRELQQKACLWLWQNGFPEAAVPYALAAGDIQLAAEIVDQCAMRALIKFDLTSLVMWINRFSDELILQRPRLGLFYALANYNLGRLDLIEPKLQVVEQALVHAKEKAIIGEENEYVHLAIESIRAAIVCLGDDYFQGILRAERVIENLPEQDTFFYGFLNHYIAYAYESAWDLEAAARAFMRGSQFAIQHHYPMEHVYSQCELARIRKEQGQLSDAREIYQNALNYAVHSGLNIAWVIHPQTGIADIYLQRNEIAAAEQWFKDAIHYFEMIDVQTYSWVFKVTLCSRIARYQLTLGNLEAAAYYCEKMQDSLENYKLFAQLFGDAIDVQIRVWLAKGKLGKARVWLQEKTNSGQQKSSLTVAEKMAIARIFMTDKKFPEALATLAELEEKARLSGAMERLIEILCLKAVVVSSQDESDPKAVEIISQAIEVGETGGYLRVFIDEGPRMRNLLQKLAHGFRTASQYSEETTHRSYIDRVLAAFASTPLRDKLSERDPEARLTPRISPSCPLSEREIQVVRLLAQGLSAKEVAQELVISINTAKTHIKNIYQKMDVHTRFEMANQAREWGLLP